MTLLQHIKTNDNSKDFECIGIEHIKSRINSIYNQNIVYLAIVNKETFVTNKKLSLLIFVQAFYNNKTPFISIQEYKSFKDAYDVANYVI